MPSEIAELRPVKIIFNKIFVFRSRPNCSEIYWAKGIHLFFLRDFFQAEENFKLSLKSTLEEATATNQPTIISEHASFSVLLAYGYLAIAQKAQGQPEAQIKFDQVISCFEKMRKGSEESKTDAEVGLDQLHFVNHKINNMVLIK